MSDSNLCPQLKPNELCFVLEQYHEAKFTRQFHEHVPRSRLSAENKINVIKSLVVRFYGFEGMGPESIVRAYLNQRGKTPSASAVLRIHTDRPEPGVLRHYCGGNTVAWVDEVVLASSFRRLKEYHVR
jgi:hypothetical protein